MKLTIDRDELLRGLSRVQAIVERRGTLPILSNALLRAGDDGLTLAATDLEVGVVSTHEANVETPGTVTLGAKKLYEIVRELGDPEVELIAEEDARVRITCGASRFSLLSISAEEYPTLPGGEDVAFVELESQLLAEMLDRTQYAISADETRYNLNGVYMELGEDGRLCFVATDGHRMATIQKSPPSPVTFLKDGIIVPRKGTAEIRKLCDETEGSIEVGLGEFLLVRRPGLLLSTRLIDGEYPDWRQVLPQENRIRVMLPREQLLHAVRRASLVANERSGGFQFRLEDGELEISASNPDLGEARERIAVDYTGDRFEAGLNARYVLDALQAMVSKEVVVELVDELVAVVLRPADDPDQIGVVMPMRL